VRAADAKESGRAAVATSEIGGEANENETQKHDKYGYWCMWQIDLHGNARAERPPHGKTTCLWALMNRAQALICLRIAASQASPPRGSLCSNQASMAGCAEASKILRAACASCEA
jgi:hypothetical protein